PGLRVLPPTETGGRRCRLLSRGSPPYLLHSRSIQGHRSLCCQSRNSLCMAIWSRLRQGEPTATSTLAYRNNRATGDCAEPGLDHFTDLFKRGLLCLSRGELGAPNSKRKSASLHSPEGVTCSSRSLHSTLCPPTWL